ncbi:hypothetical protein RE9427_00950 [Prescottella equi]|nr:hypothetical protein RE9427_00950 [Prescottella equi]
MSGWVSIDMFGVIDMANHLLGLFDLCPFDTNCPAGRRTGLSGSPGGTTGAGDAPTAAARSGALSRRSVRAETEVRARDAVPT